MKGRNMGKRNMDKKNMGKKKGDGHLRKDVPYTDAQDAANRVLLRRHRLCHVKYEDGKDGVMKGKKVSRQAAKDVPYTIDAVLKFVGERYGVSLSRLSGRMAPGALPLIGDKCMVVQVDGKDSLGIVPLSRRESNLKNGLMGIIESGELVGDVELLEDVPIEDVFAVVVGHTDLQDLRGWVTVHSNEEIMELAETDTTDFWEEWNSCGLKPRVKLGGKDHVSPSFSMMKELQSARIGKLLDHPLEYLLRKSDLLLKLEDEDVGVGIARAAAFNVVLQECHSFDWPAIVDGLVELLGGVEGWMEGDGRDVAGGLVIYKL
jgi:hypothetical protein